MAFPNVTDLVATTIDNRQKKIRDNVTDNNALLKRLSMKGRTQTFSGGIDILEEISYAENGNFGWYSGYDQLAIGPAEVLTAATFGIKQCAVGISCSGLEQLQNSGKERMINLINERMTVAESTMANSIAAGLYADGTGSGGKEITGLNAAVPLDPTTGTYGAINRATWTFWRSQLKNVGNTTTLLADMNALWAACIRGSDAPDLIIMDNVVWLAYVAALQALQRFTSPEVGDLGFASLKFMGGTDVVLDGGIGGNCPTGTAFFLNTKYLKFRPHAERNIVPLNPSKRYATNQDAEVQLMAWAGNLTCSGAQFQGRLDVN